MYMDHSIASAIPIPPSMAAGTTRGGAPSVGAAAPLETVDVEGSAVLVNSE